MPVQVEYPDWEQAALEEDGSLDPEEHHPQPYAEPNRAHVAQSDEKDLQGSLVGVAAHVLLLGHTHPADAEHVMDAVALDCWHAAKEDVDEMLPDEQYSKWTSTQRTQRNKKATE